MFTAMSLCGRDLGDDRFLGAQAVPDVEYHAGLG